MGILDVPSYSKSQSDAKYATLNKATRGRYTLPVRSATDGLRGLTVMTNPPTITQTTTSSITNSVLVYPGRATGSGANAQIRAFDATKSPYFRYHGNVMAPTGTSFPDYTSILGTANGGYASGGGQYYIEFDYDGSKFEIAYKDLNGSGMIFVDGQPISASAIDFGPTGGGGTWRTLVDFSALTPARTMRRITLAFGGSVPFYGVYREPTASIYKTPAKATKILWQGDSITEGSGSTQGTLNSYAIIASKLLGIDEVVNVAQGGTGYLQVNDNQNTGARLAADVTATATSMTVTDILDFGSPTYPFSAWLGAERVTVSTAAGNVLTVARGQNYGSLSTAAEVHYASDYILRGSRPIFRARNYTDLSKISNPDIVVISGGHNDVGFTQARMNAEALAYLRSVRVLYPEAILVAMSPIAGNNGGGVEDISSSYLRTRDAIKTAAADSQVNAIFIDLLELAMDYTPASTILASSHTSGGTTISVNNYITVGSTIDLGDYNGTFGGRRIVTAVSGSGPYTLTLNAASVASMAKDTAITEVGPSVYTGTGYIGNTTGVGNSDFMLSSDGVHPSPEGHRLLAEEFVNQFISKAITTRL